MSIVFSPSMFDTLVAPELNFMASDADMSSLNMSSDNILSTYDFKTGDIVSFIQPPSTPGFISPPIKVTSHVSDPEMTSVSSLAMTPFGPTVIKTPVFASTVTSTVSGPYGKFGPQFLNNRLILSDIFIPTPNVGASSLRLPVFNDVCDTAQIRERVTKLYRKKMLDKWLYRTEDSKYLNKYLHIVDGRVRLIENIEKPDDYKKNDQKTVDKKVDFIEENILSLEDVYTILQEFVKGTNISWCDLSNHSYFVREAIEKTLENKLKRMISKKHDK